MNSKERLFSDYDSIRERLSVKLVNYERNRQELEGKAYMPCLDLAAIFCVEEIEKGRTVLFSLSEEILTERTAEQLMQDAIGSMELRHTVAIYDMKEWLAEKAIRAKLTKQAQELEVKPEILKNERPYYLTNKEEVLGASVMLYPHILSKLTDIIGVGELILLAEPRGIVVIPKPENKTHEPQRWKSILAAFNRNNKEDALTDNVYLYRADTDKISIWTQEKGGAGICKNLQKK